MVPSPTSPTKEHQKPIKEEEEEEEDHEEDIETGRPAQEEQYRRDEEQEEEYHDEVDEDDHEDPSSSLSSNNNKKMKNKNSHSSGSSGPRDGASTIRRTSSSDNPLCPAAAENNSNKTNLTTGLMTDQVNAAIERYGTNEIPVKVTPLYTLFLRQFAGFLPFLIEVAAIISLAVQDYVDFGIIAGKHSCPPHFLTALL